VADNGKINGIELTPESIQNWQNEIKSKTHGYQAQSRNKLITEAFYLTGDIEKYGTGFSRIKEWFIDYPNLKFTIHDLNNFIQVKIFNIENVPLNVPLNERQKKIINDIRTNKYIIQTELAEKYNVNEKTIKRDLLYLQENKVIKRIGSKKTGYWQLLEGENKI